MNTPEPLRPPVVEIPAMPESEVDADAVEPSKAVGYAGGWESESSFSSHDGTLKTKAAV